MPPLRGIIGITEGVQIIMQDGTVITHSKATLPANLKTGTPAAIEAFINPLLVTALAGRFQAKIHVFSNPPLVMNIICANADATIPANWWNK